MRPAIIALVPVTTRGPLIAAIERLLPRIKYPWLFVILGALFVLDLFIPDPIPLLDEAALALLTVLIGGWRSRRTTPGASEGTPAAPPEIAATSEPLDTEDR